ncbi:MAG: galactokinase [Planctomycetota bacterium]|jgi:galactokinase
MNNALVKQAVSGFESRFGRQPRWAAAAPGRVNLIGEHTDYNDGYVLPMAIDRHVAIAADLAAGGEATLRAIDLGEEATADLTGKLRPQPESFSNYLLGVADQFAARHELPNLDLAVTGTVPLGAGLASSAAVEVAMATLLQQVTGSGLDPLELAQLCQRAEHEFAGTPCGIMDMFVATHARADQAMLLDCRSMRPRPIPLEGVSILIADTTVRRALAASAYADRRRTCAEAAGQLGVASLRDAHVGLLAGAGLGDEQLHCARHVVDESQRTLLAAAALTTGDLEALGELMFDSHASLRDLYRVSCPQLDALVEAAAALRGDGGVIGARMTGAGFGGCAVVVCRAGTADSVKPELERHFAERFGHRPSCFTVTAAGAAEAVDLTGPR